MKERIVIEGKEPKEVIRKLVKASSIKMYEELEKEDRICIYGEELKRIKVPENFAELKELCKDLKDVDIEEADEIDVARIIIHNADLIYFEDGILMIAGFKKLEIKPEKMWQIIKSLIGEE